jgi:hypothetical protein
VSRRPSPALLAALLLATGCLDFIEPELPDRGAPAVLQLTVRLLEPDEVEVEARMVPGLDEAGARRRLTDDRMRVMERVLDPDSTSKTGTRVYRTSWTGAASAGAIEVRAPSVEGLAAAPGFRWYAIRNGGPAELRLDAGADLDLPVAVAAGAPEPAPDIQQWFLTLSDSTGLFRLAADGPPPATIKVPPYWLPRGDSIAVALIYQQLSKVEVSGGAYVGLFTLDTRVSWVVRRNPPQSGAEG